MGESVCLSCGGEREQDWAPCPHCGWKAPEAWEESQEEPQEGTPAFHNAVLAKPRQWIRWTAWGLLAAAGTGLLLWIVKLL